MKIGSAGRGRRRARIVSTACLLLVFGATTATAHAASPPAGRASEQALTTNAELAAFWAPVLYHDTDSTSYQSDFLAPIDFDGDWVGNNNWENMPRYPANLVGTAYYSVVSTRTHWFILYGFFHPRDWNDDAAGTDQHENDMEGALEVVRRDGSPFGVIEAVITVVHNDFYSYRTPGTPYVGGRQTVDGSILMVDHLGTTRPSLMQAAKGHPITNWRGGNMPGGDGIVYYPAGSGSVPTGGNDRNAGYGLVDIMGAGGLWAHRGDGNTFSSFGTFRGDTFGQNKANAPWGWDDRGDGADLQRGLLATDPARLVEAYFNGTGDFDLTYLQNPYL